MSELGTFDDRYKNKACMIIVIHFWHGAKALPDIFRVACGYSFSRMSYLCTVCHFIIIFLIISSNVEVEGEELSKILKLTIPYPSGIQVDTVTDASGRTFRFGRLQHNAISIRPQWRGVSIVENAFSRDECQSIISESEKYAAVHGWSKGRHIDHDIRPTQDLPLSAVYNYPGAVDKLYERFAAKIWPSMAKEFRLDPNYIRTADLFITKYNSSRKENMLGPHQDKSPFSFVIPLNDGFKGGGTYFFDSETLWVPPVGSALYFSGSQWHGG